MKVLLKKSLIIVLSVFVLLSVIPFAASAAEENENAVGARSGTIGDCTWTVDDNYVLTISGNGPMPFLGTKVSWQNLVGPFSKVIIDDGITTISGFAFEDCAGLKEIVIPESVQSIGQYAFLHNTNLTRIYLSKNIQSISPFVYCKQFKNIWLFRYICELVCKLQ